jgi:leader peptidase (prepilin peptidase)/N-methyltransferase
MGLFLGAAVAPALLVALVAGVLVGAVIVARKSAKATDLRSASKTAIPFGPFLAFGGVLAVLAGQPIVAWYTTNFLH